jgi:predicted neutral ceramidase superfamily lipid hydrolase
MDSIRNALTSIKALLVWLPNPAVAAILLALAVAIAFLLHRIVRKLIRRLLAHRAPFVFSIFTQMRGVTQLGLVILAIIIAIPVAPVDSDTAAWMTRLVLIGMIGLVGWGR